MKANPDKFQAIAIGKKTNKHKLTFNLNGNNITCEYNVKLLGVVYLTYLNICQSVSKYLTALMLFFYKFQKYDC
jgi:hypothetical protein